jgi:hypothetical protein
VEWISVEEKVAGKLNVSDTGNSVLTTSLPFSNAPEFGFCRICSEKRGESPMFLDEVGREISG